MNLLLKSTYTKLTNLALTTSFVCSFLLILPGCGIPQLRSRDSMRDLPVSFNGEISGDNSSQVGIEEFFEDPILTGLMDEGLNGNLQLKMLAEDIQIANNEVLRRRGMYLPFVTLGGGASLNKFSPYTLLGADNSQNVQPSGANFPSPLPDFMASANLSWQIDIWRQLRNARDAASLRWLGTCEGRNYVVTRLIAEIAENYYDLLALDRRIENLDTIIEIQERSLEFSKAMFVQARVTDLPVQRFQAEVQKNQSEKLIVKQDIIETENRINFLVGRFPEPVQRSTNFYDLNLHSLSLGAPAELLQNRPDVREAERILEASGLDIKVARANFYPKVNLTAGVGYDAFNTKYLLLTPESLIWNVAGDVVAPLINKTAIKAEYKNANAKQLQALYDYQRVVLNAFTEVINRVSKVQNYSKSIEIKKQQLKSLEAAVADATSLFQNARVGYMDVLFAQRDLLDARMVLIETKKQQLGAIANTYQALGGGLVRFNSEPLPLIPGQPDASPIQILPSPEPVEATK